MGSKSQKPLGFSKTVGVGLVDPVPPRQPRRAPGRPGSAPVSQGRQPRPSRGVDEPAPVAYRPLEEALGRLPLRRLVAEWELELRVTGRSPRTIHWYLQKMDQFLRTARLQSLDELSALALKHFIAGEQDRGLAGTTVHGSFEVVKASPIGPRGRATASIPPCFGRGHQRLPSKRWRPTARDS
jgi:hypothetical protein